MGGWSPTLKLDFWDGVFTFEADFGGGGCRLVPEWVFLHEDTPTPDAKFNFGGSHSYSILAEIRVLFHKWVSLQANFLGVSLKARLSVWKYHSKTRLLGRSLTEESYPLEKVLRRGWGRGVDRLWRSSSWEKFHFGAKLPGESHTL